jgi:hypothetical protein
MLHHALPHVAKISKFVVSASERLIYTMKKLKKNGHDLSPDTENRTFAAIRYVAATIAKN